MADEQVKPKIKIQIHGARRLHDDVLEVDVTFQNERVNYVLDPRDTHGLSVLLNPLVKQMVIDHLLEIKPE